MARTQPTLWFPGKGVVAPRRPGLGKGRYGPLLQAVFTRNPEIGRLSGTLTECNHK